MFHEPAAQGGKDPASPYKTRIGTRMFAIYAIFYAGFVTLSVTRPTVLEADVFWGLNLAVVYGFSLIVFALILAMVYNHMCGIKEAEMSGTHIAGGH